MMDIQQATQAYETWLRKQVPLVDPDLRLKHSRMAESPFAFLRATFYRWVAIWPGVCPELTQAPVVLAVGDLHVENFGTWRDCEGRLIWGINDFDEAAPMPYTLDLVRLAASAVLAIREQHLTCKATDACDAIMAGYRAALQAGGEPFVLAEQHQGLRNLALGHLRDPILFWQKLQSWPTVRGGVSAQVKRALAERMPQAGLPFQIVHRQAGLGSLGRQRFTAIAQWRGGLVAREVKQLVPSAWDWHTKRSGHRKILYDQVLGQAVRVPDSFVHLKGRWLIRRLAPDCSRIELSSLPRTKPELKLLRAMGWETANVHLGTKSAAVRVRQDLRKRRGDWLNRAAQAMVTDTLADWKQWRNSR
jgi:uncharacterized protein (DUF2252 family)